MAKLSDSALVILSAACQREGARVLPLTANLKGGAINVVLGSLHKRGLIEAIPATEGDEVWVEQDGAPVTLRATAAAFEALGIEEPQDAREPASPEPAQAKPRKTSRTPRTQSENDSVGSRRETKQDLLIGMLRRPEGASVAEIMTATGWLSHTVRGAISGGLKKRLGLSVGSEKVEGRGRVYRVGQRR